MDQQGKIWGTTSQLFASPFFSLHLLRIEQGGFSSEHRHERKLNHFHVLTGRLQIVEWRANDERPDVTEIGPGESMTVQVGGWHKFVALEPTVCLEVYEAAPVEEDIIRRTVGGLTQ